MNVPNYFFGKVVFKKKMNFEKLISIKNAPLETLPSVSTILDTVLKVTEIDPIELLAVLGKKENSHFCMFEPDVFIKVATFADGLNYDEFVIFSEHVRSTIRKTLQSVHVVHKFPLWFCQVRKNDHFMLAGLHELLIIKNDSSSDVFKQCKIFASLHPEFLSTPELVLFMNFLCEQLSIDHKFEN